MKQVVCFVFFGLIFFSNARAEQGCPPGQLPAQSNGSMASCGPIPPGYYQEQPTPAARPSGKWTKTWGAIAMGSIGSTPYYGVPTGAMSESEAKQQALARCAKRGAQNCKVAITYKNQCVAISEPQVNGKPNPEGLIAFFRGPYKEMASDEAMSRCQRNNPGVQCKTIYQECSEPIFERY
jgi:hypothetical protein